MKTRTGFRKTEFANGMFKLNDRTLQLKGYAQRTTNEWVALGNAVPAWLSDYSNRLMVESNANLVRWMHVTPWKQDVESCDRVGLIEAMPAGDSEKDVDGRRWEQRLEVMRDAMIYNRNNPSSVVFYESGNKGVSEIHQQQMKDLRDKFDKFGGRASGSREMLDSKRCRIRRRNALYQPRQPKFRCGRWSIRATRLCENTGTNFRRRFTETATDRFTKTKMRARIIAIRIRTRLKMLCTVVRLLGSASGNRKARQCGRG